MSIQSEIDRINSNVQSALNAVADTGVSVPENANSNDLPAAVLALANEKQDKLTFDATPTANSTNPVTSGGVKTELDTKASATSLGAHTGNTDNPHQVTAAQVGAIPSSEKGAANGVATLGEDSKVPAEQLPEMDYAPSTHASQHASSGADPITPAAIGAAASDHTHTPSSIGAAASYHNHSASNITSGTLGVARGGTGKSSVTSGNFLVGNGTGAMTEKTPSQVLSAIGAAASSHNHAASNITAGTFPDTGIVAKTGTDYTTSRVRNIKASTTDLTAGSSALANGDIYLVYE